MPVFTHETWMLSIQPRYAMRPTACISSTSRKVGPRRALLLQEDRRRHVHERQRHELGEAAGLLLQVARAHEVAGDVHRALDGART